MYPYFTFTSARYLQDQLEYMRGLLLANVKKPMSRDQVKAFSGRKTAILEYETA